MKKILPLFIPLFFYWPMKVVEWVFAKPTIPETVMISMPPATYDCSSCPQVVGIMVDACNDGSGEEGNEFVIVHAGSGFNVDDISLDIANGTAFPPEVDPGAGLGCGWQIPLAPLMSSLQSFPGCSATNVIAAGPGTDIPAGAVVLIFSDGQVPTSNYDISALCAQGVSIYVMQNACNRTGGAFANGTAAGCPSLRSAAITVAGCPIDSLTYNRCTIAIANIATETTFVYEDAAGTQDTLILSCDDVPFDVYSFPLPPTITGVVANTSCPGDADGAIEIIAPGVICFDWAHLGASCDAQNISGLSSGIYYLTVTDAGGCQAMDSFIISDPIAITIDIFSSGLACNGGPTGSVGIDVNGGTPFDTTIIPDMPPDTIYTYQYDWDWVENAGNEVYNFDMNTDLLDDRDLSSLQAGTYSITVTDLNGCTAVAIAPVDSFASPLVFINTLDTIVLNCFGSSTTIDITVMGPPGTYQYDWNQDSLFLEPEDLANAVAGTYVVSVTEPVTGCLSSKTIVVIAPPLLSISVAETDALCNSTPTGSYIITVVGGTGRYDYADGTNTGMNLLGPTITVLNAPAGSYTVTVTDDNGCFATAPVSINVPPSISISAFASGLACNGGPTGSIGLEVIGGTPFDTIIIPDIPPDTVYTYQYDWDWLTTGPNDIFDDNGDMMDDEDLDSLFNGQYVVTVTDLNGCTAIDTVTVDLYISPIIITAPSTIMLNCGGGTANINITVMGGFPTMPDFYDYDWDQDGMFDDPEDLLGVGAGTYIVAVTELVSGCLSYDTIVVTGPDTLEALAIGNIAVCGGTPSGSITLVVTGGTGPYDYVANYVPFNAVLTETGLNLPGDTITIDNLISGLWVISITDANGCLTFAAVMVDEADTLSAQAFSGVITCDGGTTNVWVEPVGGTGPFCYDWSTAVGASCMSMTPVSEPDTLYNVPAGTYSVTVVDANDCMTVTQVTVTDPAPITYTFMATICANETYPLPGGGFTNVAGNHTDTLTAANGCDSIVTLTLTVDPLITKPPVMASFCAGDSVQVYGIWYDTPVMFTDTINSVTAACDTSVIITITQTPLIMNPVSASFCAGDSVQVYGVWYSVANTYTDTVASTTGGCDTLATITVSETPLIMNPVSASFCAGDSVQVYGVWYSVANTYTDTVASTTGGCDTLATITVSETPLIMNPVSASFCAGDSVQVYGVWYSVANTYTDTVASTTGGCDTLATITVSETPLIMNPVSASFCAGDSVQVYGVWYSVANTYTDTVASTTGGCDTLATITVSETPLIMNPVSASFCAGDSVQVYGVWYSVANTYTDTVASTTGGCDTLATITVSETPLIMNPVSASFCAGDSVQVYGVWYSVANTYTDTIASTTGGCDTLATITVSETPLIMNPVSASFCAGDSVQVYGVWYSVANTYTDTVASTTGGCDTLATITVSETPLIMNPVSASFCTGDSVQVYGVWYSVANTYTDTVASTTGGCDTLATITVSETPNITNNITDEFCENSTYILPDGNPTMAGGNYGPFTFVAANGCDSIVNLTLTEVPELTNNIVDDFCENDSYLLPDSSSTTVGGSFGPYMFVSASGCDSIVNVTLTLLPESINNIVDDFCDSDTYTLPDGSSTSVGGSFGPYTFVAANGCDSIVNVTLTLLPESINNIVDDFCQNDSYMLPDGSTTSVGGSFGPYTFVAANGCDSIVNVTLTLLPESTNNIVDDFCNSDTYTLPDGSPTSVGGSFGPYAFVAANGCDSIVNVTLTLLPESLNNIVDQFCENTNYTLPDGSMTMIGGTFGPYIFVAANGCDSIVNVDLTEVPEIINNITDDFCNGDTYSLPDGSFTSVGGSFGPYPFVSANGCDSIVNVTLTLLPESINNIGDDFCQNDSYTLPDGSTTSVGGSFGPYTFVAANGCDSIVNVTLTLLPESTNNIVDDFCQNDNYTLPDGSSTSVGGNFGPYTFVAANGCDSIVNVTLTLLPESTNNIVDDFCSSDTYTLPDGSSTSVGGSFGPYTFVAANGCDSIVNVILTLLPESTNNIVDQFCENTSYTLPDGSMTMTGGTFGPYIFAAANGCDSIVNVDLTEVPEIINNITDDFCNGDTYSLPDGSFTLVGGSFGPYPFVSANGCDSIVNVTLTLLPESINNIVDDFCQNDSYMLPDGSTTVVGGSFGPYTFVAANGCDSIVNVTLTLLPESINNIVDDFCQNDSYTLPDGSTTSVGGSFGPYTFVAANGCDSIVNVTLTLLPESTNNIVDDFCNSDTYTLPDGSSTSVGGSFGPYTFVAANGCDSIVNVTLTLLPESTNNIVDQFCENTNYTLPDGSTTMTGGTFGPYIFTAANGCDSIVTVDLTEVPEIINNITDDFCNGDTYLLPDGSSTSVGGSFGPYAFVSANGCDSIVNVNLTLLPEPINNIVDDFCNSDTYTLPDGSSTSVGGSFGPYTFVAANGCDSIVNVTLTLLPESTNNIVDDFCQNDNYTLPDGSSTSVGGSFGPYTFLAANGCDSIVNVTLTLLPESTNNIVDDFCNSDTYTLPDGSTTSVGGSFGPYTFVAANGCDSIVNVNLTLLPESIDNIVDDFCQNDNYTLPDGSSTSVGGSFGPYTFVAANGCDSIVNVSLTQLPEVTNNIVDDFCQNDNYTLPDGSTTSVGGSFGPYLFTAANGCDSIVNVTLTQLPEATNTITDDFCENDTYTLPDGSTTTVGGSFGPFTFTAANGCDSIVNVTLTQLPEATTTITDDFCENDTYTLPNGSTTTVGGSFGPYLFTAANGCDSIVNVALTQLPESTNNIIDDFCENDNYILPDGTTTAVGGNFGPFLFTAANGCDSIVNVSLTQLPEVTNNITDDFCQNESYTLPDGSSTNVGGSFGPYTFTSGSGCDSIVNVDLTMLPEATNNIVDNFCENDTYALPDGSTTTVGGSFGPFTFTAANGCDSIVNVTLTQLPEASNTITDDFCENNTYTLPDGSTTTVGGNFGPFTFTAANGCDSIVNVSLTQLPESTNNIADDFCENDTYTLPDGSSTSVGGNFGPFTFTAANGCDSIVNVTLTMLPEATNNITDDFCENDTYTLPDGSTATVGGNFGPFIFTAANGCDSIVTVTLTLIPEVTNSISDNFCENDIYTLPDGSTTTVGGSFGPYTFTSASGCDSFVNVDLTLIAEVINNIVDDFCENDSYLLPDGSTTGIGGLFGPYTFTSGSGCDSIVNVNLTLLPVATNNIVDDFCENDSYLLPDGSSTSVGGSFGPYTFTSGNGCDSIVNVNLTLLPESTNNITDDFCENDTYTLPDGSTTSIGGNFGPYTFSAANGCDSIVNVTLIMLTEAINDITDDFCENESYTLPDGSTTSSGGSFGPFLFTAANGCDSIVNVTLTVIPIENSNITDSFCENTTYTLPDGSTTTVGGNFGPYTFTSAGGCDSIINVLLTIITEITNDIVDDFCANDTYTLPDGSSTTIGGSFGPYTFAAGNGCDSIVNVTLTLLPEMTSNIVGDFCEADNYTLPDGTTTTVGGSYGPYTFTSANGCDSIVNVTLTLLPESGTTITEDFCENTTYILPDGSTTTVGGNFGPFTFTSTNGCDSIVNVNLTLLPQATNNITDDFCESTNYTLPDGSTTTVGGSFGPYSFTSANGCDSVVNVTLTLIPVLVTNLVDEFCENTTYTLPGGSTTDVGGIFGPFILTASSGCDSIVTVDLTEVAEVTNDIVDSFCEGDDYTLPDGSTTLVGGVFGPYMFVSASGCDSIVTVDLTAVDFVTGDEVHSGCEGDGYSVVVNGNIYDESNPTGTETLVSGAGCDSIVTINLTFAPAPVASITPAGPFCADEGTQTLIGTPAGGVWSGDVSSNQFNPTTLGTGVYDIIYTTSAGTCSDADTIQVVVNQVVSMSCIAVLGESAPGAMDGTGDVTVTAGTAPYNIVWTGPSPGGDVLNANGTYTMTGLSAGTYNITVTDANGCSDECTFNITSANCTVVIDDVDVIDAGCTGVNNGAIQINASGGTPPYMYSIDGVIYQSSNAFSGLAPGTILAYVQDADGCISSLFVDILTGDGPTINLVSTSPSSCGAANGSIGVNATGGTPPYNFSNGGPFQPIGTFNGLAANSYQVIVRDDSGCRDTIVVDIIDDGAPVIDGIVANSANCGQASGSITIDASGGAGILTYALNGGTPQSSNVFSGLTSGFYLIEVIDQNDCHVPSMVQIMDVGSPTVDNTIVTETLCGSNTGSIQVVASGGTGMLSYQIDNGGYSANPLFQNLTSGNHTIDIRDASGCIVTIIVNVPAADGPQISTTPVIHTTCGEDNGRITINASGGIGTLTYCIDPGPCQGDDDVFADLSAGTYEITVEDENGCSAQAIVTINDSEGPTVDGIQEDEHCGDGNGFVIIFGTGGVEPYMYSFDGRPYSNNDFYGGLSSDFYDICVRDAQGCINCEEIFIDNDDPPDFINAIVTQSSCDQNDGSITILASSFFTLEYSINCTFYQTSNVFTGLGPGTYTACIKDAFDCVTSVPVTIDPLPRPLIDNVNIINAACTAPGSLTVISSGGNGAHQYSLNSMPFQISNVFTGLGAGNYTIEIEDARGCTDQTSVTILGPVLDMTSLIETICEGEIYTVGSQDFNSTGIYEVTLPGSDGCDSVVTLNLTVQVCCTPITNTIDAVICDGELFPLNGTDYTIGGTYTDTLVAGAANGCDSILLLNLGVIPVVVTSEQGEICDGEIYDWNGQSILVAGFYTDTLVNPTTGCDSILTLDLIVNPLPVANAGADLILTCSVTSVTLDGSGTGTPQWTGPGVIDPDLWQTDVSTPGTYYLTATSSEGCIAVDSVVVDVDPDFPVANAGPDLFITCEDTVLTLQGSANTNGLLFTWTGPGIVSGQEHDEMPVVSEAGTYILTVENTANQCVSPPDTMLVTDISVALLANINANGNLDCDNNAVLLNSVGSSAGPGIVYIWLNPLDVISLDVPSITATIPGTYFLFALDTLSMCQAVDSHDVLDLTLYPQVDAGVDTILDCNVGFLELEANATGQQTDLIFSWTGPAGGIMGDPNLREIIIIAPGIYTVTATDTLNGCSNSDALVVIDSRNLPTANAGPSQLIDCRDDTAILDGSGSSTGTQYLYTWNGPGIQNVHTISIEVALPGFYRLDVTNMETGCEASDSAEVQTSDFLSGAEISVIDPICLNDESGQIIVEQPDGGVPPYQYSMDGVVFQSSPVFDNLDAGSYSLVIRDNVNCEWDTTVIINEGIELTVNIGPDIEIDFGDMTDLFAVVVPPGIIDSIVWTPVEVLSCNDCLDPVLTVLYQNDFPVTATVFAGTCVATDDLLVIVDNDFDIFVPNVFSPNHDNINDQVTAFAGDEVERILEFDIFDRWGELIFHGSNFPPNVPELGWDGDFKGKPMNSGVFVYMLKVELIDGSELILSGDITLLR